MTIASDVVGLVSVNVAEPEVLGLRRGKPVMSAIKKRHIVSGGTLLLTPLNLTGDRQADPRVHGGPDKAVYAYPAEHLPNWNDELHPPEPFGPGAFGENLTTSGWTEATVRIGDVWAWGEARLQVCQPRYPCFKLAMATQRFDIGKRMLETLRNGWYLRVLEPGEVPVAGPIAVIERGPGDATVREAVLALLPHGSRELAERIAAMPALAASWRRMLREKVDQAAD